MATLRVITAGEDEEQILEHVRRALRDPEISSFTVHKPGSHLLGPGGEEFVIGIDGRTYSPGQAAAEGVTTC